MTESAHVNGMLVLSIKTNFVRSGWLNSMADRLDGVVIVVPAMIYWAAKEEMKDSIVSCGRLKVNF